MKHISMIFSEVEVEREVQDQLHGGPNHDDTHTTAEWVALLTRHVGLAVDDGTGDCGSRFRRQMIRTAALAIAAVQSHDRKTDKIADHSIRGSGV